jgi:hypothetical protein
MTLRPPTRRRATVSSITTWHLGTPGPGQQEVLAGTAQDGDSLFIVPVRGPEAVLGDGEAGLGGGAEVVLRLQRLGDQLRLVRADEDGVAG